MWRCGAIVSTEMLTTAGVTFWSSGASVGTPSRIGRGGVAACRALTARMYVPTTAPADFHRRANGLPRSFIERIPMDFAGTCGHGKGISIDPGTPFTPVQG